MLEAARRAAAAGDLQAEVVAVASVREETSYAGARTAAYACEPDFAITLDVTHTDDYPNSDQARVTGSRALGSGPSISRGAAQHEGIAQRLIAVAARARASRIRSRPTAAPRGPTAKLIQEVRAGIPCGLVGIPLRYMHSPSETCDLRDVEQAIELVARFCRSLAPGEDWTRVTSYSAAEQVLEEGKRYALDIDTTHGPINVVLDTELGGPIPNSIAFLATKGFYDGLSASTASSPASCSRAAARTAPGTGNPGLRGRRHAAALLRVQDRRLRHGQDGDRACPAPPARSSS